MTDDVSVDDTDDTVDPASEQSLDQGAGTGDQVEPEVKLSEFSVGNQDFKTLDGFKKAYAELQKGFTQHTQKSAREMKALRGVADYLIQLKKTDPAKFNRFARFTEANEIPEDFIKEYLAKQKGVEPAKTEPQKTQFASDIEDRLAKTEAQLEYTTFRNSHADVSDELMDKIVEQVIQWDSEGKDRSLEEAHRWIMAEQYRKESEDAKAKAAKAAEAKGKNATAMGSTPATAQGKAATKNKPPSLRNDAELNAWLNKKLEEMNYKGSE